MKKPSAMTLRILKNLQAGVCPVEVMERKVVEYMQQAEACDLMLAYPRGWNEKILEMTRADRARYLKDVENTKAAIEMFRAGEQTKKA